MSDTQKDTKPNVPNLRFPGFEGEWERIRLAYSCDVYDGTHQTPKYTKTGVPFLSVEDITALRDVEKKYISEEAFQRDFKISPKKGDILMTRIGDIGTSIVIEENKPIAYYVSLALIRPHEIDSAFLNSYIASPFFKRELYRRTIHVAFPKKINKEDIGECLFTYPQVNEQKKIGRFLALLDQRIDVQNKVIEKYESLIKALRHHLFSTLEPVKEVSFADVLSYEQPTKYIVSDTEYSDDKDLTPVLTANKAFILGYTEETKGVYDKGPCIILDDFTLDTKIVDFPFKVKSSAIKILSAKTSVRLRYIYEYLKFLDLNTEEHKRHYIAEIEPMTIELPEEGAIQSIAYLFDLMDQRRKGLERDLNLLKAQKDYLLRAIFI